MIVIQKGTDIMHYDSYFNREVETPGWLYV